MGRIVKNGIEYSYSNGQLTPTPSGDYLSKDNPSGSGALSINRVPNSTVGKYSVAEGFDNIANGDFSEAEGAFNEAVGTASHAENGMVGEAEFSTTINGVSDDGKTFSIVSWLEKFPIPMACSVENKGFAKIVSQPSNYRLVVDRNDHGFVVGDRLCFHKIAGNIANGESSHVEGIGNIASSEAQHVQGKYNLEDTNGDYAHIVGNGKSTPTTIHRSNAHTLDWDGNSWYAGRVSADGGFELGKEDIVKGLGYTPASEGGGGGGGMSPNNPVGTGSLSMNRFADSEVGNYSTTLGYDNIADGTGSLSEGMYITNNGAASHAEGSLNTITYSQYDNNCSYNHVEGGQNYIQGGLGVHSEGIGLYNILAETQIDEIEFNGKTAIFTIKDSDVLSQISCENGATVMAYTPTYKTYIYLIKEVNLEYSYIALYPSDVIHELQPDMTIYIYNNGSIASGEGTHSEGVATIVDGLGSHAEGVGTISQGVAQHVQGMYNIVDRDNQYLHIIGNGNADTPSNAHTLDRDGNAWYLGKIYANGGFDISADDIENALGYIPSEGGSSENKMNQENPEGVGSFSMNRKAETAVGVYSATLGSDCTASGSYSFAEGQGSSAKGDASHAENSGIANGSYSHAEGYTSTNATFSHTEGYLCNSYAKYSHIEGHSANNAEAAIYSHTEGFGTKANAIAQHVQGQFNIIDTNPANKQYAHIVGNGTITTRSNAHTLDWSGNSWYAGQVSADNGFEGTGADYAEMFEWADSNTDSVDRIGLFVTFDDENKIRIANKNDDYILGVTSGQPFGLGNGDCGYWHHKYLHDEFGRIIYEDQPEVIKDLDNEENYIEIHRPKLNPDYDSTKEYSSRLERPEWSSVGMLGVLAVKHDGTLNVNGYCTVSDNGVATKCDRNALNSYRVIKAKSDTVAEILFR